MNTRYPQYPRLTPLTRISTVNGESILSNLANGRWVRIENQTLATLAADDVSGIKRNLILSGVDEDDAEQFVATLVEHGFLDDGAGSYPDRLNLFPFNAYLNVTDHCNLACRHCYYGSHPGLGHGVSNTDLFLIVSSLKRAGITNLVVSGGEPLTRPGVEKVFEFIHEQEFREVTLLTNGIPVTDRNAAVIAKCANTVHVSLDGATDELNAVIRGKGNFQPAVDGIKKLKQAGVGKIRVVTNINSASINHVSEMKALCESLDVEMAHNIFAEVGRANKHRYLTPSQSQLIRFFLAEAASINCDVSADSPLSLGVSAGVSCGSGTNLISVDCRGDVFPCHLLHRDELRIGNLLCQPNLLEMMRTSPVASQSRARTVEARTCHGCSVEHFCKGGCMAHVLAANDHEPQAWTKRDPFCRVHKTVLMAQLWPQTSK